jgi:hypothetical protein
MGKVSLYVFLVLEIEVPNNKLLFMSVTDFRYREEYPVFLSKTAFSFHILQDLKEEFYLII